MKDISLDQLSAQHFTDALHTTFQVMIESGGAVRLELISVTHLLAGAPWETFSLLFSGPAEHPLTQRTYHFTPEKLAAFDLFIVPVGRSRRKQLLLRRRIQPHLRDITRGP